MVTSLEDSNPKIGDLLDEFFEANGDSFSLGIGDCVSFDVDYTITVDDPTPLFNCATVEADPEEGDLVSDEDCARVDIEGRSKRRCYMPVTLTQSLWHFYCHSGVPPTDLVRQKFTLAFSQLKFYGTLYSGRAIIGVKGKNTITFTTTTMGVNRLCDFLPQNGPPDKLYTSYVNPTLLLTKNGAPIENALAGETMALLMNIAYNDRRLMPRTPGYDLEDFTLTRGLLRGKTVGQVLNIANQILAGAPPSQFGFTAAPYPAAAYEQITDIVRLINSNYAFINYNTFIDLGYLRPNRSFGPTGPGHIPEVP
jgi:hypothetical protein